MAATASRWEPIDWDEWQAFAGDVWCNPLLNPDSALPQLDAGLHHFVACVYQDGDEMHQIMRNVFDDIPHENGLVDLIPHKFTVDAEGIKTIGDELTQTEREEYRRLMT